MFGSDDDSAAIGISVAIGVAVLFGVLFVLGLLCGLLGLFLFDTGLPAAAHEAAALWLV